MIDSKTLSKTEFHNVKLKDVNGEEHMGYVDLYESRSDSGTGFADIGFITGEMFNQNQIQSIEILD